MKGKFDALKGFVVAGTGEKAPVRGKGISNSGLSKIEARIKGEEKAGGSNDPFEERFLKHLGVKPNKLYLYMAELKR